MDISKIQFGQLSQSKGIEKSFEDLDVNNDGVINEKDTAAATNKALSAEITNLLNETDNDADVEILSDFVDDTSSVKASAKAGSASSISNVDEVPMADSVDEVNSVNSVNSTTLTTSTSNKKEVKTMAEYKEILDCKFNELWEKFGDYDSLIQYVKNNLGSFMDITGDGKVDKIDLQIFENYRKLSNNLEERKEKGNQYSYARTRFAMEIRKQTSISTGVSNDTNSYTLEDVENYAKLGGNAHLLRRNLDITSIAQECDWKERLLAAGIMESDLRTTGEIYKKVTEAQEFIKNNPDKVGYAGIAGAYKIVAEKLEHLKNCGAWDRGVERHNSFWHFSHDDYYNRIFASYIHDSAHTDINNDGKFDAKDLEAISTDVDLDGDGTVSSQEREFLARVRKEMEAKLYRDITTKAISNNASIDDIITYYDTVGTDADTSQKISEALSKFQELKANPKVYNIDPITGERGLTPRGLVALLNTIGTAANMSARIGLKDGTAAIHKQAVGSSHGSGYFSDDEVTSIITQSIQQASPANTFLHYVQSADLSKDELQSILSKINGSSIPTQYKLAEVKKVVETKLAGME